MFSFTVTELHSDKVNLLYKNDRVSLVQNVLRYIQVGYLELMVHSNRDLTSYFYETVCQGLCRTSRFIKLFVSGYVGQANL